MSHWRRSGSYTCTKHLSNPANQTTTRWKEISIASIKLDINHFSRQHGDVHVMPSSFLVKRCYGIHLYVIYLLILFSEADSKTAAKNPAVS